MAAVFNIAVTVGGYVLTDVSELDVTRSVSGMGVGSLVTTCLTFKATGRISSAGSWASAVGLSFSDSQGNVISAASLGLPTFYVDTRVLHNGYTEFTCSDCMAFFGAAKLTADDLTGISGDTITADALIGIIGNKVGYSAGIQTQTTVTKPIDIESVIGSNCQQWLAAAAECNCGFFYVTTSNAVVFRYYFDNGGQVGLIDYSAPDIGDTIAPDGLIVNGDSGKVYDFSGVSGHNPLTINGNSMMNKTGATALNGLLNNSDLDYTYFKIDNCSLSSVPFCGDYFTHDGETYRVNNISCKITSAGISGSISANQATIGEIGAYCGMVSRQLDRAIKNGEKVNNNVLHTKYQGTIYLDDDSGDE